MTAMDILKRLAALKAIAVSDLGQSVLVAEQADRFIQVATLEPNILNRARRYTMTAPTRNIDRMEIAGDVLDLPANIATVDTIPTTYTNALGAYELVGVVGFEDATLEENLERENFENTVIEMYARAVGINLEKFMLTADTGGAGIYALTDGWLKLAANQLTGANFDVTDVEDMFDKIILGTPKNYLGNITEFVFYVTYKIRDDYHNRLKQRGTLLGDQALQGQPRLFYKGVELVFNQSIPTGKAWFVRPSNAAYGLFRDIRLEPDRVPKARKTDMVLTVRADANYDDENAATVASGYTG